MSENLNVYWGNTLAIINWGVGGAKLTLNDKTCLTKNTTTL
jgi:hypothetical protein